MKQYDKLIKELMEWTSKELDLILQIGNLQEWKYTLIYMHDYEKDSSVYFKCSPDNINLTMKIYFYNQTLNRYKERDFNWLKHKLCYGVAHICTEELHTIALDGIQESIVPYVNEIHRKNTEIIGRFIFSSLENLPIGARASKK